MEPIHILESMLVHLTPMVFTWGILALTTTQSQYFQYSQVVMGYHSTVVRSL